LARSTIGATEKQLEDSAWARRKKMDKDSLITMRNKRSRRVTLRRVFYFFVACADSSHTVLVHYRACAVVGRSYQPLKKRHFIPSSAREANSFAAFIQPQYGDSDKAVSQGYRDVLRRLLPFDLVYITLGTLGKMNFRLKIHL
jgi:hypothetical protein